MSSDQIISCGQSGFDTVQRPKHYVEGRQFEPIEVMRDWGLLEHHCLATALKYISRAGRKENCIEDLRKAIWYIEKEIEFIERAMRRSEQEEIYRN